MDWARVLIIAQCGVQIEAPYNTMGLIKESKRDVRALKESFDLSMVRFSPKNARIALVLRLILNY